jgi:hypothetical protein
VNTRFGQEDTLFGQSELSLIKLSKSLNPTKIELNLSTSDREQLHVASLYLNILKKQEVKSLSNPSILDLLPDKITHSISQSLAN